jgi:hypothetical protein
VLTAFFSLESTAANLTMYDLAGTWTLKEKIIENGDIPLDAHGYPSGSKLILTESCEITVIDKASGRLQCGDQLLQIDIVKKKLALTPLTDGLYNGFIDTIKQAWLAKNGRIYDNSSSHITSTKKELRLASTIFPTKSVPLTIVNRKKIVNGALRLEASLTGEYCTSIRDRFGSIQMVTCSPLLTV